MKLSEAILIGCKFTKPLKTGLYIASPSPGEVCACTIGAAILIANGYSPTTDPLTPQPAVGFAAKVLAQWPELQDPPPPGLSLPTREGIEIITLHDLITECSDFTETTREEIALALQAVGY